MLRVIDTETTSLEGSVLEIASVDIPHFARYAGLLFT